MPPPAHTGRGALERRLAAVAPIVGIALLLAATWVLRREVAAYHLRDVVAHLQAIAPARAFGAIGLTAVGYAVLTAYDALAFRVIGVALPYRRIALASFVAYVMSHNVGLSGLGGSAVRYRMLTSWGVRADDVARVIAFAALTFWLGFALVGGVANALWPVALPTGSIGFASSRPLGVALVGAAAGYVALAALRRRPFAIRGFRIDVPDARTALLQLAVSSADWLLAASVLWVLLPDGTGLGFATFVAAFLLAQVAGLASHVPGGLGVFEGALVVLLRPWLAADALLASIVAYRFAYYLLPLVAGVLAFAGYELRQRRAALARAGARLQGAAAEVAPRVLSATTFAAGAVLLFSGAMPELPERLAWLRRTLPLPWIETSKLAGSVIGALLLVLSNALRERLDAGYVGALALLVAGAVASLAKGLDWEEASVLAAMAAALAPCRAYFYRRSSLREQSLSPRWWTAVAVVGLGSVVVLELAYRHVEYSSDLWWRFGPHEPASRSLRAELAAAVALVAVALLRLLRPAPAAPAAPSVDDLDRAQAIAARAPRTTGYLALLGDKHVLFDDAREAFVTYGVSGRTWVAMGDPVGPPARAAELAWRLRELADRHGADAVFWEATEDALPVYVDLGLALRKVGEEGRVPLAEFSLEGSARKGLRQTERRMAREGCAFEIVGADGVPAILDELEAISDAWLAARHAREKRFSLGFFDRAYLSRFPVAVVRRDGRIVAFANVWTSASKAELSIDLMRYDARAPSGVMEYLFTQLMLWGRDEGYAQYGLGMAPLAGLERHRLAPAWNRVGALLFRHGEQLYHFQGLRDFKDKFDPVWEPRYLASPGGLALPIVLTRIASLVSGGVTGVVLR